MVQNFEFQYLLGFSKNEYFWYEDFVDIFWESSQNWTIFRGHFYAYQGQGTKWGYFLGLLKFQIIFGVLEIPDFFR